jgi:hypothetical protein
VLGLAFRHHGGSNLPQLNTLINGSGHSGSNGLPGGKSSVKSFALYDLAKASKSTPAMTLG